MKSKQDDMFDQCFKRTGWPKPFIHLPGVIELVYTQEEYDKKQNKKANEFLIYSVILVVLIIFSFFIDYTFN